MYSMLARILKVAPLAVCVLSIAISSARAVTFADKNLEAALRALVFEKKDNTEELSEDDLRNISTLEAKGAGSKTWPGWKSAPTCCCSTSRTTRFRILRRSRTWSTCNR